MGKVFRVREIASSVEDANAFCEQHSDCGVISSNKDDTLIFIAETVPSSVLPD